MKTHQEFHGRRDKGLDRALNRSGTNCQRGSPAARRKNPRDGALCERCGNRFHHRHWSLPEPRDRPTRPSWTICPACRLVAGHEFYGRILIRGAEAMGKADAIRALVTKFAARDGVVRPQARLVSLTQEKDGIEVLTTSQKLAHRVVNALLRAFGGKAHFAWASRDGELTATWTW